MEIVPRRLRLHSTDTHDKEYILEPDEPRLAVTRRDGKVVWTTKLPDSSTWSGPVVAGNRLWLTSNKGKLVGADAATGRVDAQISIGTPSYIAPIVAEGRLYVLTDNAQLIAYN